MGKSECMHGQSEREWEVDYLPIQAWYMKKNITHKHHFNHSFLIRVPGKLDKERLKTALEKLNGRHDMLRVVFRGGKQWCRHESSIAEIRELDIREKSEETVFKELSGWQNGFDLEKGYLWQCGIIRGYGDGSERIFIALHHLVTDVASWSIIREDLKKFYEGAEPEKQGSSYCQWVAAVQEYGKNTSEEEIRYWAKFRTEQEQHLQEWLERAEEDTSIVRYTRIELAEDVMKTLLDGGVNDMLLNALSQALYEVTGNRKNWITMEKQGREGIDPRIDVSRTAGWFTTLFPLCLTVGNDVRETLLLNREAVDKVPLNGIGYGALFGYDKLPKVLFNYMDSIDMTTDGGWQIRLGEASGESMSPDNRYGNVVDINGFDAEGKIRLGVESSLKEKDHLRLYEALKRNIETMAAWCNETAIEEITEDPKIRTIV